MKTAVLDQVLNWLPLEKFLENAPMIAWITDAQGHIRYMNGMYRRILGLSSDDLDKNIFDLFPQHIAEEYQRNNHMVLDTGDPLETLEMVVLPGNNERVFKISKFNVQLGKEPAVAGWGMDITQNLTNSALLVESHERYTLVQNAVSDAIYDWEAETNKAILEPGFNNMFGYQFETITIQQFLRLVHPDDVAKVISNYRSISNNKTISRWTLEYRVRCADDSYKHVLDKGILSRMSGFVYRAIGALRDVTENQRLQKTIIAKEKAAKRRLVRSIIEAQEHERINLSKELHDNVNQMLASCKLMLEVALDNNAVSTQFISKAHKAIQEIITEIRTISHQLNTSAVQDVGLIESVEGLFRQLNPIQPTRFSLDNNLDDSTVNNFKKEDNIAIYRIIQELVNNIIKHAKAEKANIRLSKRKNYILITIEDNGTGFLVEKAQYGIGFRNIRNRVDYYRGQLHIESTLGKGTVVQIQLNLGDIPEV